MWSRDGKELYFIAPDRQMMAVAIKNNGGNLVTGTPKALFDSKLAAGPNSGFRRRQRWTVPDSGARAGVGFADDAGGQLAAGAEEVVSAATEAGGGR